LNKAALSLRIDFPSGARIGPGKVRLLELIERTGSISAAGRQLNMSYRRAWMLVNSLNEALGKPAVETRKGGSAGGGARLTDTGRTVIDCYRAMEDKAAGAGAEELRALEALARKF
jgi:molybdate transport system regulatory protein